MKAELDVHEWTDFLTGTLGRLKDVSKLIIAAAQMFAFGDINQHFRDEHGPDGKWKPRLASTDAAYDRRGGKYRSTNKILQLTGNLRQSILPTNIKKLGPTSISIFANAPYGNRHDEGTGGMPARPFMWLSDDAKQKMVDAIATLAMEGA
jgi:phage gpG-like protein